MYICSISTITVILLLLPRPLPPVLASMTTTTTTTDMLVYDNLHMTCCKTEKAYLTELMLVVMYFCRDESLLCEGLALNDDLQRLLAKHEELSDGNSDAGAAGAPLIDTGDVNNNMGYFHNDITCYYILLNNIIFRCFSSYSISFLSALESIYSV